MKHLLPENYRILCTRPVEQNSKWAPKVAHLGCTVVEAPLLELTAVTHADGINAIKQSIMALDDYYGIIFVSQNAIDYAFEWIEQYWPQLPYGIEWLAIGKKTGDLLQQRLGNLSQVQCATDLMTSEDLLSLDVLHDVTGKKVLICRGLGGRPTLADELSVRGASVDLCELYERQCPRDAHETYAALTFDSYDILPIFSGETLDNFFALAKKLNLPQWQSVQLITPSQRVSDIAKTYGFKHIITAANANEENMLNCITALIP